ncbi:hypothetical protein GCM10009658_62120 [Planotetraspora silvatica]
MAFMTSTLGIGPVDRQCHASGLGGDICQAPGSRTNGKVPVPDRVPEVVWRAGVDLNPLDVRDAEAMRWLECLVWPGQDERVARLRQAVRMAAEDPPRLVGGDLNEVLPGLVAQAPRDATVVVFHSAVPANRLTFLTALDGEPVAMSGSHGEWMDWLPA